MWKLLLGAYIVGCIVVVAVVFWNYLCEHSTLTQEDRERIQRKIDSLEEFE